MDDKPTYSPGHERRDMGVWFVLMLVAALFVFALVAHVVSFWIYSHRQVQRDAAISSPRSYVDVAPISREPKLQMSPAQDWEEMRAAEDRALNSYGWVDKAKGQLRIPIEDAMRIVAERGLPVRPPATQESAYAK